MKPYQYQGASEEEEYFNYKLSSTRMVIECFSGQLKSRFRCLHTGLQFRTVEMNCNIIASCVLLHNFIQKNSENEHIFLDDDVLKVNDDIDDDEADSDNEDYMVAPTATGTAKRDFLRDQLWRKRNA